MERVHSFGIPVRLFETDRRFSWRLVRQLRDAFCEDRLDVAHSHSYKTAFWAPVVRRIDARAVRALVFTLHGIDLPPSMGRVFLRTINGIGALGSDALIACSKPIAHVYRQIPLLAPKTQALLNGLRPGFMLTCEQIEARRAQNRARLADRYGLDPDGVWIGAIGRLVAVKNYSLLLRGLAALRQRCPGLQFNALIAGDGPLRPDLDDERQQLGLADQVVLTGQVSDVETLYGGIDLLALTSDSEGTPMVVLEAMAYALPVVATRVGGIPDQVAEGETALLFRAADTQGFSRELERLIEDAPLRRRMGRAGYERAQAEFSAQAWAGKHVALYERALRRGRR
jgi:glycosyltransferase involved in cell wall biosynthesis